MEQLNVHNVNSDCQTQISLSQLGHDKEKFSFRFCLFSVIAIEKLLQSLIHMSKLWNYAKKPWDMQYIRLICSPHPLLGF